MINVAAFTRYSAAGPSSRVRFYQYAKVLKSLGINVQFMHLFDDNYITRLYEDRGRSGLAIAESYWRRIRALFRGKWPPVIWLEKELLPWLPFTVEQALLGAVTTVVDLDDAIFHNYDEHPMWPVRRLLGDKIDRIMCTAHTVVAGNEYLASRARRSGAARVEIVPSTVDATRFTPGVKTAKSGVVFGWVGSPATQYLLDPLVKVLADVLRDVNGSFRTLGARFDESLFLGHEVIYWSEETEPRDVASFDVGIMPLQDAPFERGKCGYKLIQYMACGLPVVASPVGVNRQIVRHGDTGFLASTPDEWKNALTRLAADPGLRLRMGAAGREVFEREYSLQVAAPRVADILRCAAGVN